MPSQSATRSVYDHLAILPPTGGLPGDPPPLGVVHDPGEVTTRFLIERRRYPRRLLLSGIRVTVAGHDLLTQCVDTSAGGVRCGPTVHDVRVGEPALVMLTSCARPIPGRIAWRAPVGSGVGEWVFGIEYTRPRKDSI